MSPAHAGIPDQELVAIWQQAASEPLGLVLRTNDPKRAKARLYAAKRLIPHQEPLADLELRTGRDEHELIIVHKRASVAAPAAPPAQAPARALALELLDLDAEPE